MNCIICNGNIPESFTINQRLRGLVKWFKCKTCKSFFTPVNTDDKEVYYLTQNPWGRKEEGIRLSELKRLMFSAIYEIFDGINKKRHLKILDIGSSFGGFAQYLKEREHNVFAYDIFTEPVDYLNSIGIKAVVANSVKQYVNKTNEKEFDAIAAIDCICYWNNINEEFSKINKILKSDGHFIIRNPDKSWLLNIGKIFGIEKIKYKCVHDHTSVIPLKTMIKIIHDSGFKVIKLSFKDALPNNNVKLLTRYMYYLGGIFYKITGFHFSPGYVIIAKKIN